MERRRTENGVWRVVESNAPRAILDNRGKKWREIRNGLVREPREYKYRPTQYDGLYVGFSASGRQNMRVVHLLAPGMNPASACHTQRGDGIDTSSYWLYDSMPKNKKLCSFCWNEVEKERSRRDEPA